MNLFDLTKKLVEFKTDSNNKEENKKCLDFCIDYLKHLNPSVRIEESNRHYSALISNTETLDFDVISIGHIDVVPAEPDMYKVTEKNGKWYGRGVADMKGYISVMIKTMEYVLENQLPLKFGIFLGSDEEIGSKNGLEYWIDKFNLRSKIVLDPDGGEEINAIVEKTKKPMFIKITSSGTEAHGAYPWNGIDANESLINTITNLRKHFPYYDKNNPPKDTWTNTMHVGAIKGGETTNKVCGYAEAMLDFRLTESISREDFITVLEKSLAGDTKYNVEMESISVSIDKNNEAVKLYIKTLENELTEPPVFKKEFGATDGRNFAKNGSIVITHQGTGGGYHEKGEWVDPKTYEILYNVYTKFLSKLEI